MCMCVCVCVCVCMCVSSHSNLSQARQGEQLQKGRVLVQNHLHSLPRQHLTPPLVPLHLLCSTLGGRTLIDSFHGSLSSFSLPRSSLSISLSFFPIYFPPNLLSGCREVGVELGDEGSHRMGVGSERLTLNVQLAHKGHGDRTDYDHIWK